MAVMVCNRQALEMWPGVISIKASVEFQGVYHAIKRVKNKEWRKWFRGSMGRTGQ